MPPRFSKRLVRALKLCYFFAPYEHDSATTVSYFEEALQIASFLHTEEEIITALMRRTFSATKLNGSDLKAFGFSPAIISAVRVLDKPFMAMTLADGKEILNNPLAEKVFLATVKVHRNIKHPSVVTPNYIEQCGVFCDVGEMVKGHLEQVDPEFKLNSDEEAAQLYTYLKQLSNR